LSTRGVRKADLKGAGEREKRKGKGSLHRHKGDLKWNDVFTKKGKRGKTGGGRGQCCSGFHKDWVAAKG